MTRSPFPDSPYAASDLRTGLNKRFKTLFDASAFPLTSVGGTANAVTATLDPPLDGDGLLDGMSFTITWADENTDDVTLAVNGGSPVPVLGVDGLALPAGAVGSGLRSLISYVGGEFVLLSPSLLMAATGAMTFASWVFESSGTWTKPQWLDDDRAVLIEAWGAGGGGASSGSAAGAGGAYAFRVFRGSELASSATVTIGQGGSPGNPGSVGGDTTFGSLLTAYGGGGSFVGAASGGGGGGSLQAGMPGAAARTGGGPAGTSGMDPGGNDARSPHGGGGGGVGSSDPERRGGWSEFGGGGGASNGDHGGLSKHGGNGGGSGSAGQAPGGGGGRGAAGARGECRVVVL